MRPARLDCKGYDLTYDGNEWRCDDAPELALLAEVVGRVHVLRRALTGGFEYDPAPEAALVRHVAERMEATVVEPFQPDPPPPDAIL